MIWRRETRRRIKESSNTLSAHQSEKSADFSFLWASRSPSSLLLFWCARMEMSGAGKCSQPICLFCPIPESGLFLFVAARVKEICNHESSHHSQLIVVAARGNGN